ncbi:Tim44 domain-containing protein [Marinomonas atlantica]|uniref:Tim44 domain-containing protein n=1 Tax=Marinomonas atlantica TaxID=1806668 RepID=UPI00082F06F8|nr:TIM44-like domain-containing protein [Marinomonas atlantica]MCO4785425.1 TIM44-like domain-containing protein [Marinomonas atlantica]
MKTSVYALLMAFVLAIGMGGFASDAEAKRLGGSKSFGKSFSTSKSATSPTSSSTSKAAAAGGTTKKSGFLGGLGGGLLGGLLAGGLFAALMGSGAFDGISFGDILLFAVIGFLIYKLFFAKKRQAAQTAGAQGMYREMPNSTRDNVQPSPMSGISGFGSQPQIQLPPGFNEQAFIAEAKSHYVTLQKAWDDNNFEEISDYFSADVCAMLREERAKFGSDKPRTEVVSLMVDLVRGEFIGSTASISLRFSGWIKEGDQTTEANEVWHLEKNLEDAQGNWTIVGIQQDN